MNNEDLKYQVENYNSLDIWKYVKEEIDEAAGLLLFMIIFDFSSENTKYGWIDLALFLISTLSLDKRSKAALIITMICWTLVKFLQMVKGLSNGDTYAVIGAILFWLVLIILIKRLWRAYIVEKEREKLTPQNTAKKTAVRKVISNLLLLIIVLFTSYTFIHISDETESCKNYRMLLQSSCVTSAVTSNLFYMLGLSVPMALLYFWIKPKNDERK